MRMAMNFKRLSPLLDDSYNPRFPQVFYSHRSKVEEYREMWLIHFIEKERKERTLINKIKDEKRSFKLTRIYEYHTRGSQAPKNRATEAFLICFWLEIGHRLRDGATQRPCGGVKHSCEVPCGSPNGSWRYCGRGFCLVFCDFLLSLVSSQ